MTKEEIATRLLLLKAVTTWAAREKAALAEAGADWKPEHREVGEAAGLRLGTVTRTKDTVSAEIADEQAALEWAIEHHPDWVQLVPEKVEVTPAHLEIEPARLKAVLAASAEAESGVDPVTGDVLDFITITREKGHLMSRLSAAARSRLEAGHLAALLAPPAGEEDAPGQTPGAETTEERD